jgi:phenylacetyl-CoA:acceptor oxidoreductase 27-kDa subunit
MRWGMVINLMKCTRCHACVAACRIEHFLPIGMTWPKLVAWETIIPGQELSTIPVRCNHCKDAPCVAVCPTGAPRKRDDGIVYIDYQTCVGCRYCILACPYQNRTFLSKDKDTGYFPAEGPSRFEQAGKQLYPHFPGTTEKCNFCMERIDAGMAKGYQPGIDREATPACVNTCQARALTFGDLDDPESEVSRLIKGKNGFQLHPELNTDPSIYYIDGKLGNATSNVAPLETRTGIHIQQLSSMESQAREIFSQKTGG